LRKNKNNNKTDAGWSAMKTINKRNQSGSSTYKSTTSPKTQKTKQERNKKKFVLQNRYKILRQDENQGKTPATNSPTLLTQHIVIGEVVPIKPPPPVLVKGEFSR